MSCQNCTVLQKNVALLELFKQFTKDQIDQLKQDSERLQKEMGGENHVSNEQSR